MSIAGLLTPGTKDIVRIRSFQVQTILNTNNRCVCNSPVCAIIRWPSNNKQLDEFIKKSQLQTNSPNHAYLEWIPFDCIYDVEYDISLYGLPTCEYVELIPLRYLDGLPITRSVKLIPLEITDSTHDLYYAEVNYLLMRHVY